MVNWIKKKKNILPYAAIRDSLQDQTNTQTESEWMKKNILWQESEGGNIHMRKIDFKTGTMLIFNWI